MIHDVDESLRTLIRRDALAGTDVEVVLDAPTKDWSARRNSPTLDMYLYDIREDLRRREHGLRDIYDDDGRIVERRKPPRYYKLSYLVTAWTQRPEDEHRLLSALLACFLAHEALPADVLVGQLANSTLPIAVTIGLPPPEDRALSDVWSALGGELKPSLDLVVTAPFDTNQIEIAAKEVLEGLRLRLGADDVPVERVRPGLLPPGRPASRSGRRTLASEAIQGGPSEQPGRRFGVHQITDTPAPEEGS